MKISSRPGPVIIGPRATTQKVLSLSILFSTLFAKKLRVATAYKVFKCATHSEVELALVWAHC